jgi:hypothetical protein
MCVLLQRAVKCTSTHLGGLLGPLHLVAVLLVRQCQTCVCQDGLHVSATLQTYLLFAHACALIVSQCHLSYPFEHGEVQGVLL